MLFRSVAYRNAGLAVRITVREFSARTGKLVRVLPGPNADPNAGFGLLWVNRDGTAAIVLRPLPQQGAAPGTSSVYGVQTQTRFTAFAAPIQRLGVLQPDW